METGQGMRRVLRCYAEGHEGSWEAFCLDLDIAVQGESFEDVFHALSEAIKLHVETVMTLSEPDRARLLDRPAPLALRLRFLGHAVKAVLARDDNGDLHHHFTLPLAA